METPTITPGATRPTQPAPIDDLDVTVPNGSRRGALLRYVRGSHRFDGLWVFALMYAALATWSINFGTVGLLYDSGGYWSGQSFTDAEGEFSLANWPSQMRGFFVPFIAFLNLELADIVGVLPDTTMKLLLAALFAWASAIVAPRFFEVSMGWRVSFAGRAVFAAFVFAFWHWYVLWPLVDFFSLALAMWALTHLLLAFRGGGVWAGALHAAVGGFALAVSLNARPVYSIVFYAVGAALVFAVVRGRRPAVATISWVMFLVGSSLVLAPQAYVNHANDRPLNPFSFPHDSLDYDLFTVTLDNGFKYPQYQVNVGDPEFGIGGIKSPDPKGELLYTRFRAECCADGRQFFTYGQYIKFMVQNPTGMGGMYLRHLMNGADTWWPSPYTDEIRDVPATYRIANYAIWFGFLGALVVAFRRRAWRERTASVAGLGAVAIVLLAPTLLVVPGGVETRYYLPLYFLAYGVVAYRVVPAMLRRSWWSRERLWLVPGFALFAWLWLDMSDAVLANMGPPL